MRRRFCASVHWSLRVRSTQRASQGSSPAGRRARVQVVVHGADLLAQRRPVALEQHQEPAHQLVLLGVEGRQVLDVSRPGQVTSMVAVSSAQSGALAGPSGLRDGPALQDQVRCRRLTDGACSSVLEAVAGARRAVPAPLDVLLALQHQQLGRPVGRVARRPGPAPASSPSGKAMRREKPGDVRQDVHAGVQGHRLARIAPGWLRDVGDPQDACGTSLIRCRS